MMAELMENAPVHSLLPLLNNCQISKHWCIPFGLRKEKTRKCVPTKSEIYLVFNQFTQ